MRISLLLVAFGLVALALPIAAYVYQQRVQASDVRAIAALRSRLDSLRVGLRRATNAADSVVATQRVRAQEEGVSRRAYHVARRQAELARWWGVSSVGTASVALGAILVVVGGIGLRRRPDRP